MVTDTAPHSETSDANAEDKKAFFAQATETATAAFNSTVEAVKANPGITAAAVAGTAAAVAGAAYGVSKLREGESSSKSGGSKSSSKK